MKSFLTFYLAMILLLKSIQVVSGKGKAATAVDSKEDLKGDELAAVTLSSAEEKEKVVKVDKSDKKLAQFDQDKDGYIDGKEVQDMAKKEVVNEPVHEPKKATKEEKSLREKILHILSISTKNGTRAFLHKYDLDKNGYVSLKEGLTALANGIKKVAINVKDKLVTMTKNFLKKHGFLGPQE